MLTAEEFAEKLAASVWEGMRADLSPLQQYERLTRTVEARDAAVRLAVLDDLSQALAKYYPHAVGSALCEVEALRAKYASKPGGGTSGRCSYCGQPANSAGCQRSHP